jgi:hypothetical protein
MAGFVKVIHGLNDGEFPVAGASIAQVRRSLVGAFNIPQEAIPFLNGAHVSNDCRLSDADTLEFVKRNGIKGAASMLDEKGIRDNFETIPITALDQMFRELPCHSRGTGGKKLWLESIVDEWLHNHFLANPILPDNQMIPPNRVRIRGKEYRGLSELPWRLLEALLSRPGWTITWDELGKRLYENGVYSDYALRGAIKRTNGTLTDQGCPLAVSSKNGFVTLD